MSKPKKKTGRPSAYDPKYDRVAWRFALLGATDPELADALSVSLATIKNWKSAHPSFLAALKAGKDDADARVVASLYRRAIGYEHKAVKILTVSLGDNQGSEVQQVPYIERYPPDTTAAIFWLKNRQKDTWRDRREIVLSDDELDRMTPDQLRDLAAGKVPQGVR